MNSLPKILIVDDEPIIRTTLESLLFAEDLDLLFAENGAEGVAMAQEHQPDAILLDVMMPGMDGYETCRRIRANPALAETHIIMITALDDRASRMAGLSAGADDFLTKPFDGVEIQVRIKNITRINRYRNLLTARSRFHWVVENAEKGYLLLDEQENIQYANRIAQRYLHLPEECVNINFSAQASRYYEAHFPHSSVGFVPGAQAGYLVQPESAAARAFWLRVESLDTPFSTESQRLLCLSDVTDEMSVYHDMRKFHLMVSHKLRTPVMLISGAIEILGMSAERMDDEDVKSMIQIAAQGVERLAGEISEIMRYIDVPIALAESAPASIEKTCNLITTVAKTMKLEHVSILRPDSLGYQELGISISAMEIIILELLENSRRFHPSGAPHVEVAMTRLDTDHVSISFCDDGQSMSAEQMGNALRPYLQGEKWFTGEMAGMGLGLSLVATLVWQSGGKLRIANHPDHPGICVTLELSLLAA